MAGVRPLGLVITILLVGACGETAATPSSLPAAVEVSAAADTAVDSAIDAAALDELVGQACQFGAVLFEVGPVALCASAVRLAVARLGNLRLPISSIRFRLELCPPNARCAPLPEEPIEGWVIVEFNGAAPVLIHVAPLEVLGVATDTLVAGAPEPLPPWLLATLAQQP